MYKEIVMRNSVTLILSFLLIAFSTNAYSHSGPHNETWLHSMMHYTTSPGHLPLIISAVITFGLAAHRIWKYFA